jgi:hypothetical protein
MYQYLWWIFNITWYQEMQKIMSNMKNSINATYLRALSCKTVADILETGKVTKTVYSPDNSNNNKHNNL